MNKYIIYIFTLLTLAIVSCDPMEEVYDELDESGENGLPSRDLSFTLSDDNYSFLNKNFSVGQYGSFDNEDQAKEYIPAVLSEEFPALGKGSSILVTYKLYNGSSPDLNGTKYTATVSTQEYEDLGFIYGDFNNADDDVVTYANFKYPDAKDGDYADITFDYYDGTFHGGAVSRVVYTVAYGWQYTLILPDAAYGDFFLESGIDFSTEDEGAEKIPAYLNYLIKTADDYYSLSPEEGSTMVVQYNFDDRCFGDDCEDPGEPNVPTVALYIFNGTEWVGYTDEYQVSEETLNFGHDGTTWIPDNTIKYTFGGADYALAGDEANGLGNAAARANLRSFGNFGTDWSHEEIVGVIDFVLKHNFPDSEVGQKYLVTYNTYPAGDLTTYVKLMESGDYEEIDQ